MKAWFVLKYERENSCHLQKQQECQYQQNKKVYQKKCFGHLQCNFNVNFRRKKIEKLKFSLAEQFRLISAARQLLSA